MASFKKCRATVPPRSRKTPELIPEVSSKADFGAVPPAEGWEHIVFREDHYISVHRSVFIFAVVYRCFMHLETPRMFMTCEYSRNNWSALLQFFLQLVPPILMDYATWGRDDRYFTILPLLFAFSRVDFLGLALETATMTFSRPVGPREPTSALLCNHEMHIFTNVIGLQQMLNGNRVVGDQCVTIQPQEPVWWIIPGQNVQGHLQGNRVAR